MILLVLCAVLVDSMDLYLNIQEVKAGQCLQSRIQIAAPSIVKDLQILKTRTPQRMLCIAEQICSWAFDLQCLYVLKIVV